MKRSTDRILTSHTGSLHRPEEFEGAAARYFDPSNQDRPALDALLPGEVEGVVRRQRELGIDVVNDGEYSKPNWLFYAALRLGGFGDASVQPESLEGGLGGATDMSQFPGFYRDAAEFDGVSIWRGHSESFFPNPEAPLKLQAGTGPITYTGQDAVDVANLTAALNAVGAEPGDGFIGVAAPRDLRHSLRRRALRRPRGLPVRAGLRDRR